VPQLVVAGEFVALLGQGGVALGELAVASSDFGGALLHLGGLDQAGLVEVG